MVRDAIPYLVVPLLLAALALYLGWWPLALLFFAVAVFMPWFFRDPQRTVPTDANLVICPADGRVTRVSQLERDTSASATLG